MVREEFSRYSEVSRTDLNELRLELHEEIMKVHTRVNQLGERVSKGFLEETEWTSRMLLALLAATSFISLAIALVLR